MNRKLLSLLLALALLLTMLPQAAPAARAEDKAGKDPYSGWCGEYLTWSFDPETGVLAISGEGYMWNFWGSKGDGSSNPIPWLAFQEQITGLELAEGLSSIGDNAFQDCLHLKSAVLPETVTRIGWYAFNGCSDLSELVISGGVTEIGGYAFSSCTGLTEVVLPGSLETIEEGAFASCTGLTSVTFLSPGGYFAEDCLSGCGELTIYGYNGSAAERFAEEQGFPFVSLGDCIVEGVCGDNLTWSLNSGTGLLTIEGEGDMWDFWGNKGDGFISSNTEPWNAYRSVITGLSLPEGLTSIGDVAFNGCWRLQSVVIPGTVASIGEYAFGACEELREVVIPEGVTTIADSAFEFCTSLSEVVLPASVAYVGEYAFSANFDLTAITFLNPSSYIAYNCLEGDENVTVYGYNGSTAERFAQEQGFPFVPLGDFTAEGVCGDNLTWSFDSATGLLTIEGSGEMWDFNTLNGESFLVRPWEMYSSLITEVSLPDGLTSIGNCAFAECKLTSVSIPDRVTRIGECAFAECEVLTSVHFPASLETIENCAFLTCDALISIELPDGLLSIGDCAFHDCLSLVSVHFPASLETIDDATFAVCEALSNVQFPAGLETIGDCAFEECSSLTSIELPDGLVSIGSSAFAYCVSLETANIPKRVMELGSDVFMGCDALKQVVFRNPDTLTVAYEYVYNYLWTGPEDSDEDLDDSWWDWVLIDEYPYKNALGIPGSTAVYGPHDPERETAEPIEDPIDHEKEEEFPDYYIYNYGYRYLENYAKTYGYTFYATNVFEDVKEGKFYELPVAWAYGEGITSGKDETHFAPGETCTRGQVVTFLWNAMGKPEPTITDCPFVDVKPGKYYYNAMLWALETGVTSGKDETHFAPNESCTRGQVVTFIWNAMGKPEPTGTDCPFVDVTPGKYYYNAMLWALENGITAGLDETHFGPNQTCTRGQVVTFLYNALS